MEVRNTKDGESVEVFGRGLLHLTVLIENMRREGFEMMVGPPKVLYQEGPNGEKLEPFESVEIELPEEYSGSAIVRQTPGTTPQTSRHRALVGRSFPRLARARTGPAQPAQGLDARDGRRFQGGQRRDLL